MPESDQPPICREIRRARLEAGLSQDEASRRIGGIQPGWSKYETSREPNLDTIAAIEQALGLGRGVLFRRAGYAPNLGKAEDLIGNDPRLTPFERRALLDSYRAALRRSREEIGA